MWNRFRNYLLLSCRRATFLTVKRAEQPLEWRANVQVKLHLMICKSCRRFDAQLRFMNQQLDDFFDASQQQLDTEVKDKIQQMIDNQKLP